MSDVTNDQVNIEEFHNNTFESIEEVVETPKKVDEPQQPVQENSQETVKLSEQSAEPLKEPFDAAKHYQSIADKRLAELEREKIKREQLEAELTKFQQPKIEVKEPPKRPVFPTRPKDYDPTEAVTNPESVSYNFERAKEDYYQAKDVYDQYVEGETFSLKNQIASEKQAIEEIKQQASYKAHVLGEIQRVSGVDIKKAEQIWDNYSTPKKDEDFLKDVVEFQLWKDSRVNPDVRKKTTELDLRNERMKQPLSPGVLPGKADDQKSPDELFNQSLENQRGNYSLK